MAPLTINELVTTGGVAISPEDGGLLTFDREDVVVTAVIYATSDTDNGKHPITGIDFSFKGVQNGSTIGINGIIYDRTGWQAGQFDMEFVENADPAKTGFIVRFIDPDPNKQ
ncbi:hypothetical protein SDC9_199823 [bioreactor metagenome]|uniref:Uncharacterized protein n=1 Tax=bioreactor metagenome TaxID=1076179 RepID=A0A645IP44_9ZZZZ